MKPIDIQALMEIGFVSDPAISPDGRRAAYVTARQNAKENRYDTWIHVSDLETGETRQLTWSGKESGFAWEDDHTLLFAAERGEADKPGKGEEKTVFYRLDITGGEARRAFEVPLSVDGIKPLGAGRYLLAVTVDLNRPGKDADETLRDDYADYHVLEEVPFWANGRGYVSRVRNALYTFDESDGALNKLTPDFFDVSGYDVKNGRLLYAGCEYRDTVTPYGEVRLRELASGEEAVLVAPGAWSVGEVVLTDKAAVIAMSDMKTWGLGQLHDWYRYDLDQKSLALAAKLEWSIGFNGVLDTAYGGGKSAAAMGEGVCFIAQRGGNAEIMRLTPDDRIEVLMPFEGSVLSLDADTEKVVFVANPANGLGELCAFRDGAARKLTKVNAAFMAEHDVAGVEYLPFVNTNGDKIDGWVLKPANFDPAKRYPGVLEIHGGPRGAYGASMHHEMQALCAAGYIVFFCNPRGSDGYGEAFADLRGKYGTIDYEDLMAFTDHVLEKVPQLDAHRLAACGGSYGGFMCNWIEGHTDRFAAIASQRSISNWVADFGSSEIGFTFDQNELGATPWTDMEAMWNQSPLKYAMNAKTPILFIHSLCDYNCTVDQGVEMFAAMKHFGVPSRMVLFEGENHSLSRSGKPRHRLRRLKEILDWFDKYLK